MLEFNADTHTYTLGGRRLPSVTQIISLISPSYDGIPESIMEYAQQRGRAVHKAVEIYNLGQEFAEPLDTVIVPYLDAWKRFVDEKKVTITAAEQQLHHPTMCYAGTFDATAIIDGDDWTLDVKAIAQLHDSIGVQLAGYNGLRMANGTTCNSRRGAVQLKPDGRYIFHEYKNKSDWPVFVSCMTITNYKANHQ